MRTHCFLVLFPFLSVVLIGSPLFGAENPEWNNLKQLSPGQQVRVKSSNAKFSKGEFQSVNDDAIAIRVKGADQRFERSAVQQVSSRRSGHRMRHALIGAAIGAAVGLGTGAAIDNDCNAQSIVCTGNRGKAILTPAFGLIGAGIGALLPAGHWQELYRQK
jgi:hypothetical protein